MWRVTGEGISGEVRLTGTLADAKKGVHKTAGDWAKLQIIREDALDGKIEFSCEALTGPNLMIDRVVLVEEK